MLLGILEGPVRRVAYYSVVHAIYGAFEIGLLELSREIATGGHRPRRSSDLWRFFNFFQAEIARQTGRKVVIPIEDHHREFMEDLVKVRNCIAHAMGDVTQLRTPHDQKRARAAATNLGLSVSRDGFIAMDQTRCSHLITNSRACFSVIVGDVNGPLGLQRKQ
jgi:hypothetical protein